MQGKPMAVQVMSLDRLPTQNELVTVIQVIKRERFVNRQNASLIFTLKQATGCSLRPQHLSK